MFTLFFKSRYINIKFFYICSLFEHSGTDSHKRYRYQTIHIFTIVQPYTISNIVTLDNKKRQFRGRRFIDVNTTATKN
jgi:hypothetical protein